MSCINMGCKPQIEPQVIQDFLDEYEDIRENVRAILSQLRQNPENSELIQSLYRSIHTLKGNAAFCFLDYLSDYLHSIEDLLDKFRHGRCRCYPVVSDVLERLMEHIDDISEALKTDTEPDLDNLRHAQRLLQEMCNKTGVLQFDAQSSLQQ